jgi:hypothetical protein
MALKEPVMIKTVIGNKNLELTASAESFLIHDIMIHNPASNYVTLSTSNTHVGYFRVGGPLGSHLPFVFGRTAHSHNWTTSTSAGEQLDFAGLLNAGAQEIAPRMIGGLAPNTVYYKVGNLAQQALCGQKTLLGLLRDMGIFTGYPVANGETFTIEGAAQNGAIQTVLYSVYDKDDIKNTDPNGSESTEQLFVSYGHAGASINAEGETHLGTMRNPGDVAPTSFPWTKDVPSGKKVILYGILASDFAPWQNTPTNYCFTRYIKMTTGEPVKILFDEDKKGLLAYSGKKEGFGGVDAVAEGCSVVGNYSSVDSRLPFFFKDLEFPQGANLDIYWNTEKGGTGAEILTDRHEIGLIMKLVKV